MRIYASYQRAVEALHEQLTAPDSILCVGSKKLESVMQGTQWST